METGKPHYSRTSFPPHALFTPSLALRSPRPPSSSHRARGWDGWNRTYRAVFQQVPAACRRDRTTGGPRRTGPDIGPGAPHGRDMASPFWKPWLNADEDEGGASKTLAKQPASAHARLPTSTCPPAPSFAEDQFGRTWFAASKWRQKPSEAVQGHPAVPRAQRWTRARQGREKGLDEYYELDVVSASPTAAPRHHSPST